MVFIFCYNHKMIFYSVKYSGIKNSLDGRENSKFRGFEEIEMGN